MAQENTRAATLAGRPVFKKLHSRRLFEEVCEQIQAQMAAGTIKVGDRLPAERELAAQFGISRSAVREALRSLEIAGLITIQKGTTGGSFVTSSEDSLARAFQSLMSAGHLPKEDLSEARAGILELVVRLAAQRATRGDIDRLKADIERTAAHLQESIYLPDPSLTQEFYYILAESTGNKVVIALTKVMSILVYESLRPRGFPIYFDIINFRQKLVELIEQRDSEGAVSAIREYLAVLEQHIQAYKAP